MYSKINKRLVESYWENIWIKFLNGDIEAFEAIYNEHIDFLYSYGSKITKNTILVEDAIQDLFLYLFSKRENLITPNSIKLYILKAFKRILIEKVVKEKHYLSEDNDDLNSFELMIESDGIVEKKLTEKKIQLIENLLNDLDAQKKEVLYLKFYSGLSYNEIGEIVGLKSDSVKKMVYRIISSFRSIIKEQIFELFLFISRN